MADRKPLKVLPDGGGDSTGLSEFRTGDTIGVANGGTGLTTVATSNILTGNGTSALSAEAGLTFDGSTLTLAGNQVINDGYGMVIGGSTQLTTSVVAELQVYGAGSHDSAISISRFEAGSDHGHIYFLKSRNATAGSVAIVQDNDNLGAVHFMGDNGATYNSEAATVRAQIDGSPSSTSMPGRLVFQTTATNAVSPTERMRIHSTGLIQTGGGGTAPVTMNTGLNARNDAGLTIMQDGHDDEILTFKSSDVAHGMTDVTDTNTYARFYKRHGSYGGLLIEALMDPGETSPLIFTSTGANPDDTRSTAGKGMAHFDLFKTNGTGRTSLGGTENLVTFADANTTRFIFAADGTGHADVAWTTYSDTRLKKNIETVPYGLDEVLQLEPKVFDKHGGSFSEAGEVVLEGNGKRQIGFLAQDVRALMPELVDEVDDSKSFYSLSDGKLAAVLVRAIQELNAKLEAN